MDQAASCFACWYKFTKIKSLLKIFWLCMIKNGCGQSGLETLILAECKELSDGINWFFEGCIKFTQIKRWLKNFLGGLGQK